ncbi:MAG: hypothetical protein AAGJ87_08220 [Pseudomonadota bacterium]
MVFRSLTIDGARRAIETLKGPGAYLDAVQREGCGAQSSQTLSDEDQLVETLSMGLRPVAGLDLARLSAAQQALLRPRIHDLATDGLVTLTGNRLAATPDGRRVLNSVIAYLLG